MLLTFLPRLALSIFSLSPSLGFTTPNNPTRTTALARSMSREFTAEVVGASGRMGTFWLDRHFFGVDKKVGDTDGDAPGGDASAIACPRGTTPGSQTPEGSPIYVATTSDAYLPIYESTPPSRCKDLVLVGNVGLPIDDRFQECTILVPHFSVLYKNQWKDDENNSDATKKEDHRTSNRPPPIQVNTDPLVSPPTYIYGNHAITVANVLEAHGIATEVVPSFREIKAYSGRKLVWASCFWLLCHNHDRDRDDESKAQTVGPPPPLTVGEVHEFRQNDLQNLVDEILPSLRGWLLNNDNETETEQALGRIIDRTNMLDYLQAYSESISYAVPSVDLAKREFKDRNAVWLSSPSGKGLENQQPFHVELLRKQGRLIGAASCSEDR